MRNKQILGFLCILVAVATWGFQPIATGYVMRYTDSVTFTFIRFALALPLLIALKFVFNEKWFFTKTKLKNKFSWLMIAGCVCGIVLCNLAFAQAMNYATPITANVIFQLAPLWFLLGCLIFFKEKISKIKWIGIIIVFLAGFIYIFDGSQGYGMMKNIPRLYSVLGIVLMIVTTLAWAMYALSQKPLLNKSFTALDILIFIAFFGAIILLPMAHPTQILIFSPVTLLNLGIVTVALPMGFVFFALSLKYWENYKTSIIMAGQPVITIIFVFVMHPLFPKFVHAPRITLIGCICVVAVILGTGLSIISKKHVTN